jgi:hypothetical protein
LQVKSQLPDALQIAVALLGAVHGVHALPHELTALFGTQLVPQRW